MLMIVPRRGRSEGRAALMPSHGALEIDRQRPIPEGLVGRLDRPARADPRTVDQEVQPAPSRDQQLRRSHAAQSPARVTSRRSPTASKPVGAQLGGRLDATSSSLDIGQHDLVRRHGERSRDPQADPLGRTRHQGHRSIRSLAVASHRGCSRSSYAQPGAPSRRPDLRTERSSSP